MNADPAYLEAELTRAVIGEFFNVYNRLGFGFLESVYRRALGHQLIKRGIHVECEVAVNVWFDGIIVGQFRADMLVERKLVVEIKASHSVVDADWKQLLNYLNATELELGLLLHFGPKAFFRRFAYSNSRKAERYRRP